MPRIFIRSRRCARRLFTGLLYGVFMTRITEDYAELQYSFRQGVFEVILKNVWSDSAGAVIIAKLQSFREKKGSWKISNPQAFGRRGSRLHTNHPSLPGLSVSGSDGL